MIKRFTLYLAGIAACVCMIGCNDTVSETEFTYGSTQLKSFKLVSQDTVLNNLDSVFFSIDLVDARVFNADSLPFGTKVDKLAVNLTTDACSTIELKFKSVYSGNDTTVNYMTNSTELINFASGPVTLHLVSFDKSAERDYQIKVNVHQTVPDSLYWDQVARRNLPTSLSVVRSQKTTRLVDTAVCLTSNGSRFCIATTDNPGADDWSMIAPTFTFTPDVASLEATDEALYILSTEGKLYRSADKGATWAYTGVTMYHLYGCYGDRLLGVVKNSDGSFSHASYKHPSLSVSPSSVGDCPVAGTSQLVSFDSKWSVAPQLTMQGGRKADGSLTNATWGYDGKTWAKLSETFPVAAEGVTLVSYIITSTDTIAWTSSQTPALLAFGGRKEVGVNDTLYISRDFGVHWSKGGDNLQLPSYMPATGSAQALVYDTKYKEESSAKSWKRLMPKALKPITEWSAPFIYLFGGHDAFGVVYPYIWKGVINSLTFKPLQ